MRFNNIRWSSPTVSTQGDAKFNNKFDFTFYLPNCARKSIIFNYSWYPEYYFLLEKKVKNKTIKYTSVSGIFYI